MSTHCNMTVQESTEGAVVIGIAGRIASDNAHEAEQQLSALRSKNPNGSLVFDAADLEYISSAGLRMLMRLVRKGDPLKIINASSEVYDVFHMTGLTEIMDVRRALREISLDGAQKLGAGANGEVWRIDDETIIKVYNEGASLEKIDAENQYATAAFKVGLPCAIAFDTVRVGSRYGIVFEMLNARTVGNVVTEHPERVPELGRAMGELLRELHSTHMKAGSLPRMTDKVNAWIDYIEATYVDHDDAELMRSVVRAIPEKDTVLHLDFHEGNVMLQGDELVLIDLDDVCVGNPVYDLLNSYSSHILAAETAPEVIGYSLGTSVDVALTMYDYSLKAYFGTDDHVVVEQHVQAMRLLTLFNLLLFLAKSKDSKNMTPERAQGVLNTALPTFRRMAPQIIQIMSNYR